MGNLLTYLDWRKDKPLDEPQARDTDLAVLARMAYLPMAGIVPESFEESVPLPEAMLAVRERLDAGSPDRALAEKLAVCQCFAGCRLTGHVDIYDPGREEQFAAFTLLLPDGSAAAADRGTDDTLVASKEDFNMTFASMVPAQRDALAYLLRLAARTRGELALCGHSKGGNLAMFAAVFCPEKIQSRIRAVCNFDGPGFSRAVTLTAAYRRMIGRMHTYLPQSSVVGMLLEHEEDFPIVEREGLGIQQHNLYRWQMEDGRFKTLTERTNSSVFVDGTMKNWVYSLKPEQREKTINAVYQVLAAARGKTFRDLTDMRSVIAILRAAGDMDQEQRKALMDAGRMLRRSMKAAFPALLERYMKSAPDQRDGGQEE